MILTVLIIATLLLTTWFFLKNRRYEHTPLKETLSDDMRREVNLPSADEAFLSDIKNIPTKERASAKILKALNQDND